ncbi:hypothetical protein [Salirhabdus sp. Marseille-P4669]|uniref:hypothetical protein n=1 Tax=Salirhabdus sp. Marseille-P4669 TaxID=2042310 RepID=UPI000C7E032F|nr:hypothetical protein [Salirhabdus sp. Marseille-P4669]
MKICILKFLIICCALLAIVGCQSGDSLKSATFKELYPSNLSDVTRIEIRHGSGELKVITEKSVINEWLEGISEIAFIPEKNQEDRVGYLYSIQIYEENKPTFRFNTIRISNFYYEQNDDMLQAMKSLFEEN